MHNPEPRGPGLFAISDLHISFRENRELVEGLRARSADDWLIVAGDVAERYTDVEWALTWLRRRFAKVVWTPGNHELWTDPDDPIQLRGEERYRRLVRMCRDAGVVTPEDPYEIWPGPDGPVEVVPMFLLYDYTFRAPGTRDKEESLAYAYRTGVVCTDEVLLHPDPYPGREAWCQERVRLTEHRLAAADPALPKVLINHYPLVREPTRALRYPEFAQWCGTERTADWHRRFNAAAVVYGHLHIPRLSWHDGVPFEEVSVGYPREWRQRGTLPMPREIRPHCEQPRPDAIQ
ncbi:metallophosphoesterase [Dactylosporangium vinaceum]|uniref:Metallophosphoesterase family protein n=1 Tax=Dactylosporangium vinaceum TaxID=53362 RepID=A0ABV5MSV4_9ACTN|nr:metallophosphoesterase [Dactylosporangium vinaceum]